MSIPDRFYACVLFIEGDTGFYTDTRLKPLIDIARAQSKSWYIDVWFDPQHLVRMVEGKTK